MFLLRSLFDMARRLRGKFLISKGPNKKHDLVRPSSPQNELASIFKRYPFTNERATVEYLKSSKIFFIMRGLPGSGKSTVARALKLQYPEAVICSADDFFITNNGMYSFDSDKLHEAHGECEDKAKKAASSSVQHVIIDNTNIQRWNMQQYFEIANLFNYRVIIVEPKTPWKDDVAELTIRNSHGCTEEIVEAKKKTYQEVFPLYWGWFFNEKVSSELLSIGETCFNLCMENISDFAKHMNELAVTKGFSSPMQFHDLYNRAGASVASLHCTSFFSGSKRKPGPEAVEYASRAKVKESLGQASLLKLVGVMITPRTIGLRVSLNSSQFELWGNDDLWDPQKPPIYRKTVESKNSEEESIENKTVKDSRKKQCKKSKAANLKDTNNEKHFENVTCSDDLYEVSFGLENLENSEFELISTHNLPSATSGFPDPNPSDEISVEFQFPLMEIDSEISDHQKLSCDNLPSATSGFPDQIQSDEMSAEFQFPLMEIDSEISDHQKLSCDAVACCQMPMICQDINTDESLLGSHKLSVMDENNLIETVEVLPLNSEHVTSTDEARNLPKVDGILSDGVTELENVAVNLGDENKTLRREEETLESPLVALTPGSRAHVTLGFATEIYPVQTGFDQMELTVCEENGSVVAEPIFTDDMTLTYYGEGRCTAYFNWPLYRWAVFTGNY